MDTRIFRTLAAIFALFLVVVPTFAVQPDDSRLQYTGRWDTSNPAQPWSYWIGSSLLIEFWSESLDVTMAAGDSGRPDYLRIILDGNAADSVKIPVGVTPTAYTLASDLTPGSHYIEIVKETDLGRWSVHSVDPSGGGGILLDPADRPSRRLVFYGDSNLAGYSLESEQNESGDELRGSYRGYAGIAARMLDAEYQNISRSGATISSLHGVYDLVDYGSSTPLYDFSRFPADAVVVNVGANDVGRPEHRIRDDYHALLDDLRAAHPDAHIVVYNAWGWDYDEPANFTHEVVAERGDPDMSCAVFPWIFEQWHGCEYDHAGMARILTDHLSTVLGWEPDAPDVMSGFARFGDFANGGFEQVAPFGGFGWRYYTDAGVSRIHDPTGAPRGEYFLRLADGATVHQPIPAEDGEKFAVAFRLRAGSAGSGIRVTLDFRDQEMWTTPLASTSEVFAPDDQWQVFSISAVAPTGSLNPVFHARLTFAAEPGSSVEVDDIGRATVGAVLDAPPPATLWAGPNPFNPSVKLEFMLPAPGRARLRIFDVSGRLVAVVADGMFDGGTLVRRWDGRDECGRDAASGSYFARLEFVGGTVTSKIALIR